MPNRQIYFSEETDELVARLMDRYALKRSQAIQKAIQLAAENEGAKP